MGTPTTTPMRSRANRSAAATDDRRLQLAAIAFTIAVLVHNTDHLRRGADAVTWQVFALGTLAIPIEAAVVVLVCARHRLAPLAAGVIGTSLAVGYLGVHFVPRWSALSDSLVSGHAVDRLAIAAAGFEVAAAVALAAAGFTLLRARGGLVSTATPQPGERPLLEGARSPVASVVIAGNAVILAIAVWQLVR